MIYPVGTLPTGDYETPRWADLSENVVEPSDGQKDAGWSSGERPPSASLNWLHYITYIWVALLDVVLRAQRVWRVECWDFVTANLANHGWTAAGSFATTVEDPTSLMRQRHLKVAGGTGVNSGTVAGEYFHYFTDDTDAFVEFDLCIASYGTSANYEIEVGVNFSAAITLHRFIVRKDESSANWYLMCEDATGGSSDVSTVVATAGQVYRMRLEYSGANRAAAGQNRVRLYIDGVLEGEIANANVPFNDKGKIYIKNTASDGGTIGHLYVGPPAISTQAGVTEAP